MVQNSQPTILARKSDGELANYFNGLGWEPFFIEGNDSEKLNPVMAEKWIKQSRKLNPSKRSSPEDSNRCRDAKWPVLIVRTPKDGPVQKNGTGTN